MALMAPQPVPNSINPAFTTPTVSDTFVYQTGLALYVKIGVTATTCTLLIPGNDAYTSLATQDQAVATAATSTERVVFVPKLAMDPATGLVTVTYSQVTNVTSALFLFPF